MSQFHFESEDEVLAAADKILTAKARTGCIQMCSPKDGGRFFRSKIASEEREVFSVAFLDSQHRLITFEILFQGTVDSAHVYPREVVKAALAFNASAVIVAHNHPSGITEPSNSDRRITDRLKQALDFVDIPLLDHLIVSENSVTSLAELGML